MRSAFGSAASTSVVCTMSSSVVVPREFPEFQDPLETFLGVSIGATRARGSSPKWKNMEHTVGDVPESRGVQNYGDRLVAFLNSFLGAAPHGEEEGRIGSGRLRIQNRWPPLACWEENCTAMLVTAFWSSSSSLVAITFARHGGRGFPMLLLFPTLSPFALCGFSGGATCTCHSSAGNHNLNDTARCT